MRKAFLSLDTDYDGFINVEDIFRYFGNMHIDYDDLKKLIENNNSENSG